MARKRGERWQGLVKIRGQQISRTFDTQKEAKAWEELERLKYSDASFSARLGRSSVQQVVNVWLSIRSEEVADSTYSMDQMVMRLLPAAMCRRQIRGIKAQDLQLLIDTWRKRKTIATVRRYADSLAAFFRWAEARGYILNDPMKQVEVPRRKKKVHQIRPMDEVELTALVETIGGFNGDVVLFLALTGLRWGEARSLRVGDVYLEEEPPRIHVMRSHPEGMTEKVPKSGHMRIVPLAQRLLPIVQALSRGRDADDYLLSRDGSGQLWRGRFARSANWAQVSGGRTLHDLRHSAACNWLKRGVPVNTVQAWLGHADLETTAIYTTYLGMGIDLAAYERMNG